MKFWKQIHSVQKEERLPVSQKICYGFGGLSDFFIQNTVQALAIPIFAVGMGLDPLKLGIALAATKLISAIADPVAGILSDKTRTRFGRRKPFLIGTAVVAGILCPLLFRVPDVDPNQQFMYIFGMISVYFLAHSFYAVPYTALGYELTENYDERTSLFAWKNYIGMIGVFAGAWSYWFTMRPCFGNEMNGAVVLAIVTGMIVIVGSIFVTKGTHEIVERKAIPDEKISVLKALKTTITNKSFLLIQGALLVVALGVGIDATIGMYLHVHYACGGDKGFASLIGGAGGTVSTIAIFFALAFAVWISKTWGKKAAAITGVSVMLLGACLIPWLLNPVFPWLIVIVWVLNQFGSQCSNLIYGSMMADVCDEDELNTGERREGSYAAAGSFLNKMMQGLVMILSGAMPRLAGYVDTSIAPNLDQLLRMKTLLVVTDVIGIGLALLFLCFYPLTRERCAQIRRQLNDRSSA